MKKSWTLKEKNNTCMHIHSHTYVHTIYSGGLIHFTLDNCTYQNVSVLWEKGSWISGFVPEKIKIVFIFKFQF